MLRLGAGRVSNQRVTTFAKSGSRFMSELVTAAKVKNSPFDKLDIRPVQRPDTAAYFMAKPKYADLLSGLSQLVSKYPMARYNKSTFKTGRWIKKEGMESKLNIKLTENEYRQLVIRLCEVENVKIEEFEERQLVSMYLNQFRKGYSHVEVVSNQDGDKKLTREEKLALKEEMKKKRRNAKRGYKDDLGRWYASGRRKEATACAWIVPVNSSSSNSNNASAEVKEGEAAAPQLAAPGEILINGKPLAEYFARDSNRESVIFPFQVIGKIGQYNAFVTVKGGGLTGQAEACQLAVARAVYASNRAAHANIRLAGLNRADGRSVERKKTGKPKARKSYTWVKR